MTLQRAWIGIILSALLPAGVQAGFLDNVLGARPAGMGEAFVSVADDANALLYNPAGYNRIDHYEASAMYANLYAHLDERLYTGQNDHTGYNFLAALVPLGANQGTLGMGWSQLNSVFYKENTFILGYGRRLLNDYALDAGVNVKGLQWMIEANDFSTDADFFPERSKTGLTADVGFLATPWEQFNCGLSVDNLIPVNMGLTVTEEVPMIFRCGAAYLVPLKIDYLDSLQSVLEYTLRKDAQNVKLGLESWWLKNSFAFRCGVNFDQATSGLSFKYAGSESPWSLRLDYAFAYPFQILDSWGSHRVSLSVFWDPKTSPTAQTVPTPPMVSTEVRDTNTATATRTMDPEYQEYIKFKRFMEFREQEAAQAAQVAQAAKVSAQAEARKAAQSAEMAKASNFPVNLRDKIVLGCEHSLLSDFAGVQDVMLWAEKIQKNLMRLTGLEIEKREYNSIEDLMTDFQNGEIDILIGYCGLIRKLYTQGLAVPLDTFLMAQKDSQKYCLYIRDEPAITTLAQLQGKRLGYMDVGSLKTLKEIFFKDVSGYSEQTFFKEIKQMKSPVDSILALQLQEVDVVIGLEYLQTVYQRIEKSMLKRVKIIAVSGNASIPNVPMVARARLTPAKQKKVMQLVHALQNLSSDPEGRESLKFFQFDGFVPFDEDKYRKYLKEE